MEQDYLELYELQQIIREGIEDAVPGPIRVKAEIAQMQQRANGHCYLELVQSGISGPVAKIKAVIWRSQVSSVLGKFAAATGDPLKPGVAVIFSLPSASSESGSRNPSRLSYIHWPSGRKMIRRSSAWP